MPAFRKLLIPAVLAAEVVASLVLSELIGLVWTFLWLLGAFVLGVVVIRFAGARAWSALRSASSDRAQAVGDTPLLFLAGLLLAVPGVLSDVVGLALLAPPVRGAVRAWFGRRLGPHVTVVGGSVSETHRRRFGSAGGHDLQAGELVEDAEPERPDEGGAPA